MVWPWVVEWKLLLACDLIIASSNAKFALPEPKVGLAALSWWNAKTTKTNRYEKCHGHDANWKTCRSS